MVDHEDPDPELYVPPPPESKRNLASVLLSDLNTVAVTTAQAVTGAYAVKKILGRKPDDDGGSGPDPDSGS